EDGLYLTTHESALAVVATSMKKARLLLDTLIINSFIGGVFFTSGGMLHVMLYSDSPQLLDVNPGVLYLIQGLVFPIGLFFVVIMGVDLFNSNILFFSVGVARGAVSILDLIISWFVSWWLNLVGNIFVCYIICNFSSISSLPSWVTGSIAILNEKLEFNFVQTLIKSMAGNFFVCLAIYMQLMAKPIHVKLILMTLPIFVLVSLGFTHAVADMFLIIIGLINGAPTNVATVAWKLFLPGALGNIIGGAFFSLIVPFYLHIVAVERDQRKLRLPRYEMRDQQPEINQDSRVVRGRPEEESESTESDTGADDNDASIKSPRESGYISDGASIRSPSIMSRRKVLLRRSPSNVFPVYGMGPPREREQSIA
ncbi:putative formate transporter 1, partial [Metschnikowia bicuspidata var. bicuspidata NRRL YB-4993]